MNETANHIQSIENSETVERKRWVAPQLSKISIAELTNVTGGGSKNDGKTAYSLS